MLSKREIADRIIELRQCDNFIQASDWDRLLQFLGDAFDVPDSMLYADAAMDLAKLAKLHKEVK